MVAEKVVQKVQSASCEDLWKNREKPKGEREQELINLMRNDAQVREEFFKKTAVPVANKMFECGMFP